ncbi:CoA-disulfide reductase [Pelosinus sp. IPA-1]|uniref:CoA-disulfide reductase n=1 Tax=Pelosinus sp. IPA-1 TaxID=3029569 RepID=UPI0024362576|nr:CoA-disulfide reductase [Pelosinus sp. IPA-1]GMB01960.1 CoA-disulfide reductase [Pelosinus sp. IPA-1]
MKIIIIGAEAAGASAAAKAKRLSPEAEIIIYEKSDIVSFGACGLPYFVANCFGDTDFMISRTVSQFAKNGITVKIRHEVVAVDVANKGLIVDNLETGERKIEKYDRLMIATGAAPIIPPIENLKLKQVFTLKTMADGVALKQAVQSPDIKNVVIIGAGFIGMEVTEAMVQIGKNVRLIQLDERVMSDVFDMEITEVLEKEVAKAGVALNMSEIVKSLTGTDKVCGVVTDKGEYPADLVVVAVGVKPNTAFLQDTGMAMLKNGAIIIDKLGQTSIPDIYAAGDCATVPHFITNGNAYIPLATTANKIGKIVGENLVGKGSVFPGTLGSAAVRTLEFEAGRTGLTEKDVVKAGIPYGSVFVRDKNHSNYLPGQSDIFVKLIYGKETRKLLGGQVAGKYGSALRANMLATAIWNGMTVDELGMLDLFYAPPFSRPWDVLNIAANAAK